MLFLVLIGHKTFKCATHDRSTVALISNLCHCDSSPELQLKQRHWPWNAPFCFMWNKMGHENRQVYERKKSSMSYQWFCFDSELGHCSQPLIYHYSTVLQLWWASALVHTSLSPKDIHSYELRSCAAPTKHACNVQQEAICCRACISLIKTDTERHDCIYLPSLRPCSGIAHDKQTHRQKRKQLEPTY